MPDGAGAGGFIGNFIGGYTQSYLDGKRRIRDEEHQREAGRLNLLSSLAGNQDIAGNPEALGHVLTMMDDITSGNGYEQKSKGGKGKGNKDQGHLSALHHVLGPLGQVLAHQQGPRTLKPLDLGIAAGPQSQVQDPITGGAMPSAPGQGILGAMKSDRQREEEKRALQDRDLRSQQDQDNQAREQNAARIEQLHSNGKITDAQYQQAIARIQGGVGVTSGSSASLLPKLGWAEVSDGKGGTKRVPGRIDPSNGSFTTLTGKTIDPELVVSQGTGNDPNASRRVAYKLQELTSAAKATHPDWSDAQVNLLVGQQIEAEEGNKITQSQVNIAKGRQSMAVTGAETGIGGGGGGLSAPSTTFTSPSPRTPTEANRRVGSTPNVSPQTTSQRPNSRIASQTSTPSPETSSSTGNTRSQPKGGSSASPVNIQHLINSDDSVMAAKQWLTTGMKQGGSSGKGGLLVRQGLKKLMAAIPGATEESLTAEAMGRAEANKSIALNYSRLEAYGVLTDQIDRMAKQMIDARKKLPNDPKVIAKWKNAVKAGWTDDPQLSEALTAANEFQKTYAKFLAGAGTSNAQTNVSAQEKTDALIDASMGMEAMKGAVRQVRLAAKNELGPIKDGIKRGQAALSKDWGNWNPDELVPTESAPSKERKVGDMVNYNGKPHKILEIKPNGKYVLES